MRRLFDTRGEITFDDCQGPATGDVFVCKRGIAQRRICWKTRNNRWGFLSAHCTRPIRTTYYIYLKYASKLLFSKRFLNILVVVKSNVILYLFINMKSVSRTNLQPELTLPWHENMKLSDIARLTDILTLNNECPRVLTTSFPV